MKISLSGASGVIGSAIYKNLSDGFDLICTKSRLENIDDFIKEVVDSDVFINNANGSSNNQLSALINIYKIWRHQRKLIINIGSRSALPNVSKGYEYSTYKNAIIHFSSLVTFQDESKVCKITTINPGLVEKISDFSLGADEVANVVRWVLIQPEHIEISRIDLQHISPYLTVQGLKKKLLESKSND